MGKYDSKTALKRRVQYAYISPLFSSYPEGDIVFFMK